MPGCSVKALPMHEISFCPLPFWLMPWIDLCSGDGYVANSQLFFHCYCQRNELPGNNQSPQIQVHKSVGAAFRLQSGNTSHSVIYKLPQGAYQKCPFWVPLSCKRIPWILSENSDFTYFCLSDSNSPNFLVADTLYVSFVIGTRPGINFSVCTDCTHINGREYLQVLFM